MYKISIKDGRTAQFCYLWSVLIAFSTVSVHQFPCNLSYCQWCHLIITRNDNVQQETPIVLFCVYEYRPCADNREMTTLSYTSYFKWNVFNGVLLLFAIDNWWITGQLRVFLPAGTCLKNLTCISLIRFSSRHKIIKQCHRKCSIEWQWYIIYIYTWFTLLFNFYLLTRYIIPIKQENRLMFAAEIKSQLCTSSYHRTNSWRHKFAKARYTKLCCVSHNLFGLELSISM